MKMATTQDRSQRQILVNVGNRYVVFGTRGGLPQSLHFRPETHSTILPRVADESDIAYSRIIETLEVSDLTKEFPAIEDLTEADIVLRGDNDVSIFADIKVRNSDLKTRDFDVAARRVRAAADQRKSLEVWFFNIERLGVMIVRFEEGRLKIDELVALDVWEHTSECIFRRSQVIEEVEDWLRRVSSFYDTVQTWLQEDSDLRFDRSRTVVMSEEMMQNFAVTDREIPILDVIDDEQVIASFVPRGLWIVGAWGRIDVITRDATTVVFATREETEYRWEFLSATARRDKHPFDKSALVAIVRNQ
ncbi:hypothetical protein PQR05_37425 [Paraburkholderia sediminicola]|uniref:hypothetical protein n=1 Tax=Paraburkholderia sediminicola TaxID=458836 RepID=UPI0038B6DC28